jgi:2-phospho-L-lactate guanylyltransferase
VIWAIVPLRGLASAKTRLGPALDAAERLEIVISMARRTLGATRDARWLAGTVLVTADPAAAELARGYGALALVQRLPGLNAALREGRDEAVRAGAEATIIIPIDLPGINAEAIDRLLDDVLPDPPERGAGGDPSPAEKPIVALVPDRHGLGTNILFTMPPGAIDPAFGFGSLAAHRAAAHAAGARLLELGGPLVLDVDTEDDLHVAGSVGTDGQRGPI